MPFLKGSQHTAAARAKMSRSGKRRAARDRERLKLTPKAVRRYLAFRKCAPGLKPLIRAAEEEMVDLVTDLTGGGTIEDVPAAKRLLLESAMQTLVASRAMFAMFVETRDVELASRMATQLTALHRVLLTLGLEKFKREIDLAAYLEQKARENRAGRANGGDPDADPTDADDRAPVANGDGGAGPLPLLAAPSPGLEADSSGRPGERDHEGEG